MKTVQGIKHWLRKEIERLEGRHSLSSFPSERASLEGSIITCKKLLEMIK